MTPLFETILDYIPAPEGDPEAPTQVLISTIDYNEYVGRIGVGKVDNGTITCEPGCGDLLTIMIRISMRKVKAQQVSMNLTV